MDEPSKILAGRYELGETIGRGGMAEVHVGYDRRLGRTVAIKVLRSDLARDPSFLNRFRREAQAAAALNHPAIVAVYDTGEDTLTEPTGAQAHVPFIVMEYVEGHTVREMLRDGQPLPLDEALDITTGVLSALEYSHHAGIVHRDIKPANVMLTTAGAVKVMDFGIARAVADSAATMTQTQAVVGTAQYLSPEQARGEQVDARTDLYSTGCLLFELLTGRPPFVADSMVAVAYQHVREQPPLPSQLNPALSEALDRIVHKSLTKDREARYQTAAEFRADLEAVQRGTRVLAPPLGATAPALAATQVLTPTAATTTVMPPATAPAWQATGADSLLSPPHEEKEPKSHRRLIITLIVIGVLAVAGIIFLLLHGTGSGMTTVPDVTNRSAADAEKTLHDDGFAPVKKSVADATVATGNVVKTDPGAGESAPTGSQVTYYVSTGPGSTKVPPVSGLTAEQATAALQKAGLTVNANQQADDNPDFPEGQVTKTDPAAGVPVDEGAPVTLYVSTGRVKLPDLTGKSETDAQTAVAALKLTAKITEQESATVPVGNVISMDPAAGQIVAQNSVVSLVVAKAPSTGVVPSGLPGLSYNAAVSRLQDVGFTGTMNQVSAPSETVPAGQVVSTNPTGGQTVPLTQAFTITVSSGAPTPTPTVKPTP